MSGRALGPHYRVRGAGLEARPARGISQQADGGHARHAMRVPRPVWLLHSARLIQCLDEFAHCAEAVAGRARERLEDGSLN